MVWPRTGRDAGRRGREQDVDALEQPRIAAWTRRRTFWACATQAAGTMAPASRRSRTAGSKSPLRVAQTLEVEGGALGRGDEIGGGAGPERAGQVDDRAGAERTGDGVERVERLGFGLVGEIAPQAADPQARDALVEPGRTGSRRATGAGGIVGIGPLHRIVAEREVCHAPGERAEVVEARDEGEGAGAAEPAVGRLQAEQPAERGRHPDRPVGVGAERQGNEAGRHRAARAARGAARHAGEVMRVARGSVMDVLAGESHRHIRPC